MDCTISETFIFFLLPVKTDRSVSEFYLMGVLSISTRPSNLEKTRVTLLLMGSWCKSENSDNFLS